MLAQPVINQINKTARYLEQKGLLLHPDRIRECSELFRSRFGPDRLAKLQGEELLRVMHDHLGKGASMAYWLEYKDDWELPDHFGSIAGGFALKFGLYRSKRGAWVTRDGRRTREMSLNDAITMASRQRNQLVKGAAVIERRLNGPSRRHPREFKDWYRQLETELRQEAPDVSNTAWGHKYFSLLWPDLLDNYHVPDWQRFHLAKLWLAVPPETGRYQTAAYFASIARQLGLPLNHLTRTLNEMNGRPHKYWLLAVDHETGVPEFASVAALPVDWGGDLEELARNEIVYRLKGQSVSARYASQVATFVSDVREGDLLLIHDGPYVLAVGRVKSPYFYAELPMEAWPGRPHRRGVQWLNREIWHLPAMHPKNRNSFFHHVDDPFVMAEVERRCFVPEETIPHFRIGSVQVGELGRLNDFNLTFSEQHESYFGDLQISALVGRNGTGKTSLLRFLADLFRAPKSIRTEYSVTYVAEGLPLTVTHLSPPPNTPGARPRKVIVSSYSPFERYEVRSTRLEDFAYEYVGPQDGLEGAFLPILQALHHRDPRKRQAFVALLSRMGGYTQPPLIEIDDGLSVGKNRFRSTPHPEELGKMKVTDNGPVRSLLDFHRNAQAIQKDKTMGVRLLSLEQVDQLYESTGGLTAWISDLRSADHVRLIENLWFPMGEREVPLSHLSSGELSLFYRLFRLIDVITDGALVILDEPEVHLHPRWVLDYVYLLKEIFGQYRAHFILATHSPLLAGDLPTECITCLRTQQGRVVAESLRDATFATTPMQVLDEVFDVHDSTGQFTRERIEHIERLIETGALEAAKKQIDRLGNSVHRFSLFHRLQQALGKEQ